jgi:hypothetical protein
MAALRFSVFVPILQGGFLICATIGFSRWGKRRSKVTRAAQADSEISFVLHA